MEERSRLLKLLLLGCRRLLLLLLRKMDGRARYDGRKGKLWCYEHCEGRLYFFFFFDSVLDSLVYPHEKKAFVTFQSRSKR
jgi:hypothetical protein